MTTHHTASVEGLEVFYREAGDLSHAKLLLLGGFPASSHQFRNLIPALADRFHVLSPDYPGFGSTDMPDPATWDYTFDPEGGEAYLRDLPDAKMVRLNSGHFAVEDCLDDIVNGIKDFYDTNVK
jgi:pimeloyl-ACP methyl ester carboxylesterase